MIKIIEKIKKKDSAKQDSFIFGVSFIVTGFVFLIWFISLFYGVSIGGSENTANTSTPLESISNKVSNFFSGKETYTAE
ncbi:hypothetical protein GW764_03295 [Candidatus Parcubacteria bacterium]|nr:hypothetical protein [Candidatus Parcubacteria bacterium]